VLERYEAALLWRFVAENAAHKTGVRGLSPKARRDARGHSVRELRCDSSSARFNFKITVVKLKASNLFTLIFPFSLGFATFTIRENLFPAHPSVNFGAFYKFCLGLFDFLIVQSFDGYIHSYSV
jgi:hypothetical protein